MTDQAEEGVLAWVGTDPDRACQALAAEQQRDWPRTALVAKLTRLAAAAVTVDIAVTSVRHTSTAKEL
jgi:hypothetical protein